MRPMPRALVTSSNSDSSSRTFSRKFVEAAAKLGIKKPFPHHVDVSAYDTMYVLKSVMEAAKITGDPARLAAERTAIRDTLGKLKYDGLIGNICFESNGDAQLPGYVLTMKDKKWVLLDEHKSLPCKK